MNIVLNEVNYKNPLFVFALKSEAAAEFEDYNCVFVGVGKVNATYHLLKAILNYSPDIIINLGTAGSTEFLKESVVCCSSFIQRDMEVSALGFKKFETPFSTSGVVLQYGLTLNHLPNGICGSGDQFETEHKNPEYNVVDMEAFALATVAKEENIPFLCLKYISDGADGDAVDDWNTQVKKAAVKLKSSLFL